MDRPDWTRHDDSLLLSLIAQGCSIREAAEKLGRTRNSLIGRYHRLKGTKFRSVVARKQDESIQRAERLRQAATRDEKEKRDILQKLRSGMSREQVIFEARSRGVTLALLGDVFQISRERVRQIEAAC